MSNKDGMDINDFNRFMLTFYKERFSKIQHRDFMNIPGHERITAYAMLEDIGNKINELQEYLMKEGEGHGETNPKAD